MARLKGSRKCPDCGRIHLPEPQHCNARKALPLGCPGCMTADSLKVTRDQRVTRSTAATLRCRECGAEFHWTEGKKWEDSYLKGQIDAGT